MGQRFVSLTFKTFGSRSYIKVESFQWHVLLFVFFSFNSVRHFTAIYI